PGGCRGTRRFRVGLVGEGKGPGPRVEPPDGLFDPRRYFLALQRERFAQLERARRPPGDASAEAAREAALAEAVEAFDGRCGDDPARAGCRPLYVVAEKILGKGERLPSGWAVHGTTGYEFLNLCSGLFVDGSQVRAMSAAYAAFTGARQGFADVAYDSKKLIMEVTMSSELSVLGHRLNQLAEQSRY